MASRRAMFSVTAWVETLRLSSPDSKHLGDKNHEVDTGLFALVLRKGLTSRNMCEMRKGGTDGVWIANCLHTFRSEFTSVATASQTDRLFSPLWAE